MVVFNLKRFSLVFLLFMFSILFSSFSSAQDPTGCCCVNEGETFYYYGINQSECSLYTDWSFSTQPTDDLECQQTCASACEYLSCSAENIEIPCACGTDLITATSDKFCCAADSYQKIYDTKTACETNTACAGALPEHTLTGFVYDQDSQIIVGATVTVESIYTGTTDDNGEYSIENIPERAALTAVAAAPNCIESSQTTSFMQDESLNFTLTCGVVTGSCAGACCAPNTECVGGNSVGQLDCASGYTCYEGGGCSPGDTCTIIDLSGEECSYGECSTPNNAYCEANNEWRVYDINTELDAYCALCAYDANCLHRPCQSDNTCNGVCPANCGPGDDPDCAPDCYPDTDDWCDTFGIYGDPGLAHFDVDVQDELDNYCSHCALQDPVDCESDCGNGILEFGEQCDPPSTYCDSNCQSTTPETCDNGVYDSQIEECDSSIPEFDDLENPNPDHWENHCPPPAYTDCELCSCVPACRLDKQSPSKPDLGLVPEAAEITISWINPNTCGQLFDSITVRGCYGEIDEECNDFFPLPNGQELNPDTTQLATYNIQPRKTYRFYVSMMYTDGSINNSEPESITTGDAECMEPHKNEFCVDDRKDLYICDDQENILGVIESCSGYCYITEPERNDVCIGSGICKDCNSLYGVFANFSLGIDSGENFWKVTYEPTPDNEEKWACQTLKESNVCKLDQTTKTVDKLESCTNVTSCYGYKSYDSCLSNPCGKFLDISNNYGCEWESYEPTPGVDEFHLGVCHPTNLNLQNCSICTTNDNPIFPVCNYNLCSLFGECYFSEKNNYNSDDENYPKCGGIADTTCRDYDNEIDCTGEITFYLNENNSVGELSNDYFNLGKCKWDSDDEVCYRDADDDAPQVPPPGQEPDCNAGDLTCEKDFESPVTRIDDSLFPDGTMFNKNFTLPFSVSEDVYPLSNLKTYFCITEGDNKPGDCADAKSNAHSAEPTEYELLDLSEEDSERLFAREFEDSLNPQDEYYLYYFSKDSAKNLEPVNVFNFFIDAKDPEFEFEYDYNSYETFIGWRNDMWANFSFDEPVTCTIILKDIDGEEKGDSTVNKPGTNFHVEYPELADGTYWFEINCSDVVGNKISDERQIKVEGDKSITDPKPEYERFFETDITLSVNTSNFAKCRYSTETYRYSDMSETDNHDSVNHKFEGSFETDTDGLYHTKTINFPGSDVYKFYTACNISYEKQETIVWNVTEGSDADWIVLSIDRISPVTVIYNSGTGEEMDFNRYYKSVDLEFVCEEPNFYIDNNGNEWGMTLGQTWDGSFGCVDETKTIYLCQDDICEWHGESSVDKHLPEPGDSVKNYTFFFKSKDNATALNNTEELRSITVMIDSTDAELDLTVTKGEEVVETLTYGTYKLTVDSTKPIANVTRFSYVINYESGSQSDTISLASQVEEIDDYSFYAHLTVDIDRFYNQEGQINIIVEVEDTHEMKKAEIFQLEFVTRGPPAPEPEPIFNIAKLELLEPDISGESYRDELGNWYPFIYYDTVTVGDGTTYNETYLIRQTNLSVTGYTFDIQGEVLFYLIKGLRDAFIPRYRYDQLAYPGVSVDAESKPLKISAGRNSNHIMLDVPGALGTWTPDKYINFHSLTEKTARTDYENYGKFYLITESVFEGAAAGHRINFTPSLQEDLDVGDNVYLYEKDYHHKWFGEEIELEYSPSGDNLYKFVLGLNDSLNLGFTDEIFLFVDNGAPITTAASPLGGTVNSDEPIAIELKEHLGGSGLKQDSLSFGVRKNGILSIKTTSDGIILTNLGEEDAYNKYRIEYLPGGDWTDGHYNITINVEDQAGNKLDPAGFYDEQISFVVDRNRPSQPLFTVVDTTADNIDSHKRTVVDNNQPSFELDFTRRADGSVEQLDITVPAVTMLESEINTSATCSMQSKNLFICNFDNTLSGGLYSIAVSASKVLPNGSLGPEGTYIQDRESKSLTIIVDQTAPTFTLQPESSYIRPGHALTVFADVTNEQYDLLVGVIVEGEEVLLEVEKSENQYLFIIPETFDWGLEGTKTIQATISDYAGHQTTETANVIFDASPPEIIVTAIGADQGFLTSNTNATVGVREITLIGTVDSDTNTLCYQQTGGETSCIFECVGNEDECIRRVPLGDDTFQVTIIVDGSNSAETLNAVFITLTDFSGHETTSSLYILLDLEPPGEPTITFT